MAISATTVWRVRPSGSNVNGGGFDPNVSGVLSTTLNGSINNSTTTVVVTSATGWPGSGNYYARIGSGIGVTGDNEIVLVTGGQGTTSWTVTRGQLGTTGTAFNSGTVVDNELSRCNTAMSSGSVGTSTNSTTFTEATGAFNSTHVGNILWIASGAGATVGPYIIQSVTNATTLVLDRVSGTYTLGVWRIGGAWADPKTNFTTALNYLVPGNKIYVLGSGIPNISSYTYDYSGLSGSITMVSGDTTNGRIRLIGDPNTPNFLTGGRPVIQCSRLYGIAGNVSMENLWFVAPAATGSYITDVVFFNDVTFDQFGYDISLSQYSSGLIGCRIFSSVAKRSTNTNYGVVLGANANAIYGGVANNCNFSGCIGPGVSLPGSMGQLINCLISKNGGNGVTVTEANTNRNWSIIGCTIDGNSGDGINIGTINAIALLTCFNNIISNHTTSGKYPITVGTGTTDVNDKAKKIIDYNVFYNNLNAPNAVSYGSHDQTGGADPFVNQGSDDYTLTSTYVNTGYPQANLPGF